MQFSTGVVSLIICATVAVGAAVVDSLANHQHQTLLTDVPSVRLQVTFKRESMKLYGQSQFSVFANPIVSTDRASVLYDGYSTFMEGNTQLTYSLLDGVAYLVTKEDGADIESVKRIPPSTLSFQDILPALNNAMPIPSVSVGDEAIECTSGNLFKTAFGGVQYAICTGESGFTAFSSDLTINVEYLESSVEIPTPKLSDELSCEAVAGATSVTPTAVVLISGSTIPTSNSRNLKSAEHMEIEASPCKCMSTPRPCVFFHGIGKWRNYKTHRRKQMVEWGT